MRPLPMLPSVPSLSDQAVVTFLGTELRWHEHSSARAEALVESGLPPLVSLDTLPYIFGISESLIYSMIRNKEIHYRSFDIPKANGGSRRIDAPKVALKVIQRWIHDHILAGQSFHPAAAAYVPGRGILYGASLHAGARSVLTLDLVDFFPSVTAEMVGAVFSGIGYEEPVAWCLAELCTKNDGLPQGAPSSPLLSNMVMQDIDQQVSGIAERLGCRYSRYADDLTFSSALRFDADAAIGEIADVLEGAGFKINARKTRVVGGGYRRSVTGLSVSDRPMAFRAKRRVWRALFNRVRLSPEQYVNEIPRLTGIAGFINMYDSELAARYLKTIEDVKSARGTGT